MTLDPSVDGFQGLYIYIHLYCLSQKYRENNTTKKMLLSLKGRLMCVVQPKFTNLPAGITAWFLDRMYSLVNFNILTYFQIDHWLAKGACMGSPFIHSGSFLPVKMWNDPRTQIEEMFLTNCFNFTSLVQNLWRVVKVFLFSLVTSPVWEPTSNGVTITLKLVMSLEKCWYFSSFSLLAVRFLVSFGTVSSNM